MTVSLVSKMVSQRAWEMGSNKYTDEEDSLLLDRINGKLRGKGSSNGCYDIQESFIKSLVT